MSAAGPLTIRTLAGAEIGDCLADLAALRIAVFASFPYLYEGSLDYEADYVREFAAEPGSVMIAAFAQGRIVGVATASPMAGQKAEFRRPFEQLGFNVGRLFYFGESVLLPEFRGQGAGHAFFDQREAAARAAGASHACFASVIRPADHQARPADYTPLDGFWTRRGYAPLPGVTTQMHWQDHGEAGESAKTMQYWLRPLD